MIMTFLRRLEIVCGVTTALLGIAAAAQMFSMDMDTARELGRGFPLVEEVLGALLIYILPGLLVSVGSYLHSLRLRTWGFPMVIFSSLAVVIIFTLLFLNVAFYSADLTAWLNLSLAVAAVVTMIVSIVVNLLDRR